MNWYFVGVDFGQSRDFTAIAILERAEQKGEWDAAMYAWRKVVSLQLRHLERIPLGTPYPEVVERVVHICGLSEMAGRCQLTADATGVGRPVVELLRRADPGCSVTAVNITGGLQETSGGGYVGVPKRELIVGLQVLLQGGKLRIAAGLEHGPALVKEMAAMQVKVTPAGNEQFGAWREGSHDDLVLALALACWSAQKAYPNEDAEDRWCLNRLKADRDPLYRRLCG